MIPLSVLDLSVVTTGTKPAAALRNSIDLARHVDGLGYVRYWLAEHHNLASVASPAPDVMIGQIAAAYYFAHFLIILPLVSAAEKPRPLPNSITEAVLAKHGGTSPAQTAMAG